MEGQLFGNSHWYQQPHRSGRQSSQRATKVVQIPVQFVRSEQQFDRSGSALKIQKVFRGFMVRKCLRKISEIKAEVDAAEARLQEVDSIRGDVKERVRMNETLMSLLLKLDSITGIDFGVRVFRKAVIRKAIALQETIDTLVAVSSEANGGESAENAVSPTELSMEDAIDGGDRPAGEGLEDKDDGIAPCSVDEENLLVNSGNCDLLLVNSGNDDCIPEEGKAAEEEESGVLESGAAEEKETKRRREELMERVAEENAKMMRMMERLCERNEAQERMLNALGTRVAMLEKAFMCDVLTRRKKEKLASACV